MFREMLNRLFISKDFNEKNNQKMNDKLSEISKEIIVKQNSFKTNVEQENSIDKEIKEKLNEITNNLIDINEGLVNIDKNHPNDKIKDCIAVNQSTIHNSIVLTESL